MSLLLAAVFIGLALGLGLAEQWREWLRLRRMAREVAVAVDPQSGLTDSDSSRTRRNSGSQLLSSSVASCVATAESKERAYD